MKRSAPALAAAFVAVFAAAFAGAQPAAALDLIPHPDEDRHATGGYTYDEGLLWLGEPRYVPPREDRRSGRRGADEAHAAPEPYPLFGFPAPESAPPRQANDRL